MEERFCALYQIPHETPIPLAREMILEELQSSFYLLTFYQGTIEPFYSNTLMEAVQVKR